MSAQDGEFLAIVAKKSVSEDPLRFPSLDSRSNAMLDAGESTLLTGDGKWLWCSTAPTGNKIWKVDGRTAVTLTDQRLMYVCEKFTKGGGHLSVTRNVVGGAVAMSRRAGRIAVGQVRLQWPQRVVLISESVAGIAGTYVAVECETHSGPRSIVVNFGRKDNLDWVEAIVRSAARFRLANMSTTLSSSDQDVLSQQADSPTANEAETGRKAATKKSALAYDLPGSQPAPF